MLKRDNKLELFLESNKGHEFLGILILLNAVIWGLQTLAWDRHPDIFYVLHLSDDILLGVFLTELAVRIYASGFRFFEKGWNLFDAFVILIALAPSTGPLLILRTLRLLRVERLISLFPKMRIVVSSISRAIPGILSVAGILLLSFYVASIIAFNLFASDVEHFGSLSRTMFTLFQLMLGDDWGNIIRPLLQTHPHCYLFFIPFMILMTFTVLNLFFGLIVNSMQEAAEEEDKLFEGAVEDEASLRDEIKDLKDKLEEIKILISR